MSQENAQIVLKLYEDLNRGDIEGILTGWHPDGEYRGAITDAVEGDAGVFRGHDGIRRWWRDMNDLWDDIETEVLEVRDLGEQVFVAFIVRGRGAASGVSLEQPLFQVFTLRDGKVTAGHDYISRLDALEAVGPSD